MHYEILIDGQQSLYDSPPSADYTVRAANPVAFLRGSVYWNSDVGQPTASGPSLLEIVLLVDGQEKGKASIASIDRGVYASAVPMFIPLRGLTVGHRYKFQLKYAHTY